MAQTRQLAFPAYFVAFPLFLIPLFDSMTQVIPFRFGDPRWRFGAFGLASNALMLSSVGLLLAFLIADMFEHRRLQRVLGVVGIVFAVALLIGLAMFALDVLQVRKDIAPRAKLAFTVASITAMAKAGIGLLAFAGFGWAGLRGPKAPKAIVQKRGSAALIIGGKPTAIPVPLSAKETPEPVAE